jgi:hypothetical protein
MPLYVIITIGWVAGKIENVDIKSLAFLSIYVLAPITVIGYIMQMEFKPIYIGLPLVIALFPPDLIGVYMFMLMGNIIFGNTVGYYIWMRGNLSGRESLMKVLKFPGLYAFIISIVLNIRGVSLNDDILTYWAYFKGAYIVIGMLIIGTALSRLNHLKISLRFISMALAGKFIVWPLVAFTIIMVDRNLTHIFDDKSHQMFFILSIVPPAANITAFAAQLNVRPDKAATTILISTVVALFSIPFTLALSGLF